MRLLSMSIPLSSVSRASAVFCVGLDTRFGRSVVGVQLRRAIRRGAKIITIHPRSHSLSFISDQWIQTTPGMELGLMQSLAALTAGRSASANAELKSAADVLRGAENAVILVGPEYMAHADSAAVLDAVAQIAQNLGAGVMALPAQGNLIGSIMMGAYPELLPGGFAAADMEAQTRLAELWGYDLPAHDSRWNTGNLTADNRVKVLYLIGSQMRKPHAVAECVIFQNFYPPTAVGDADLVLPSAAFIEVDGTFINGEGRVQGIHRAVEPPGAALPDWAILCRLAQRLGRPGFDYASAHAVREEITAAVPNFGDPHEPERRSSPLTCAGRFEVAGPAPVKTAGRWRDAPFVLSVSLAEHSYHGFPLSLKVGGAAKLFAEDTLEMSAADAAMLGLSSGDRAVVKGEELERIWPVRVVNEQPASTVHVVLQPGDESVANPYRVHIRKADV